MAIRGSFLRVQGKFVALRCVVGHFVKHCSAWSVAWGTSFGSAYNRRDKSWIMSGCIIGDGLSFSRDWFKILQQYYPSCYVSLYCLTVSGLIKFIFDPVREWNKNQGHLFIACKRRLQRDGIQSNEIDFPRPRIPPEKHVFKTFRHVSLTIHLAYLIRWTGRHALFFDQFREWHISTINVFIRAKHV